MAKRERICTKCQYNNNGWCNKLKTNKGLKDLMECEHKLDNKMFMVKNFIDSKEQEFRKKPSERLRGEIEGLKLALTLISIEEGL